MIIDIFNDKKEPAENLEAFYQALNVHDLSVRNLKIENGQEFLNQDLVCSFMLYTTSDTPGRDLLRNYVNVTMTAYKNEYEIKFTDHQRLGDDDDFFEFNWLLTADTVESMITEIEKYRESIFAVSFGDLADEVNQAHGIYSLMGLTGDWDRSLTVYINTKENKDTDRSVVITADRDPFKITAGVHEQGEFLSFDEYGASDINKEKITELDMVGVWKYIAQNFE